MAEFKEKISEYAGVTSFGFVLQVVLPTMQNLQICWSHFDGA